MGIALSSGFRRQCFQNSVHGSADNLVQTIRVLTTGEAGFGPAAPQELAARWIEEVNNDKTDRPFSRRLGSVEFGKTRFRVLRGRKIVLRIVAYGCDRLPCPFQHDMIGNQEIRFALFHLAIAFSGKIFGNGNSDLAIPVRSVRDCFGLCHNPIRQKPKSCQTGQLCAFAKLAAGFDFLRLRGGATRKERKAGEPKKKDLPGVEAKVFHKRAIRHVVTGIGPGDIARHFKLLMAPSVKKQESPSHVKFELYMPASHFDGMIHNLQWLG